jgi:hypothetical protein
MSLMVPDLGGKRRAKALLSSRFGENIRLSSDLANPLSKNQN